jgi:hypothetical protein
MSKRAVSLTLSEDNLLWLKGRARHGRGTLSGAIDRLISEARAGGRGSPGPTRSVVGTIDLAADDPRLERADRTVHDLFAASLARPSLARASRGPYDVRAAGRRGRRRG